MLAKRDNFRRAFAGFDAEQVARYDPRDVAVRGRATPGHLCEMRRLPTGSSVESLSR
jgi:hypothetical protein